MSGARSAPAIAAEIVRSTRNSSAGIRRAVDRGELVELGHHLYTSTTHQPPEQVVARNLWRVVTLLVDNAAVVDKTAFTTQRDAEGAICLAAGTRRRTIELPGLSIRIRPGGPEEEDTEFMGLRLSSQARAFLDNLRDTRARGGFRWTLTPEEIETRLDQLIARRGEAAINELRDNGRRISERTGQAEEFTRLDELIGSLQGTRKGKLTSPTATARAAGVAYDTAALARVEALAAHLRADVPALREASPGSDSADFAFWESYFSNYIEGTVFTIDVAHRIVFENYAPANRSADAHDISGTFELANDRRLRDRVPATGEDFEAILKRDHQTLMEARPDKHPGEYKLEPNQAGSTSFVAPGLVRGTLLAGFEIVRSAQEGLARAAVTMFLVAEVHPFDDGNGRMARLRMNAELTAVGEQRIIVPTGYRTDYLGALRRLSRNDDPSVLGRMLDRAQAFSREIDWTRSREDVGAQLERTNAFREDDGRPLRLPSELG